MKLLNLMRNFRMFEAIKCMENDILGYSINSIEVGINSLPMTTPFTRFSA
jgi:hypothetical protein